MSRNCFHPGESRVLLLWLGCPSPRQVCLAAALAPLPASSFTSCKRGCRPAVSALLTDACWPCFHRLQRLDCVPLLASHADLFQVWGQLGEEFSCLLMPSFIPVGAVINVDWIIFLSLKASWPLFLLLQPGLILCSSSGAGLNFSLKETDTSDDICLV